MIKSSNGNTQTGVNEMAKELEVTITNVEKIDDYTFKFTAAANMSGTRILWEHDGRQTGDNETITVSFPRRVDIAHVKAVAYKGRKQAHSRYVQVFTGC
jgi:hypothetical protein